MEQIIYAFTQHPIAQTIGIAAYFLSAFSASQKDEHKLRNYMALSALVWSVHHFALNSPTAGVMLLIIGIRCFVASSLLEKGLKIRLWATTLFLIVNIIGVYFTWEGGNSLFALLAATVATVAVLLTQGLKTRLLLISVEALWLAYNIHVMSLGGIIACLTDGLILTYVLFKDFVFIKQNKNNTSFDAIVENA